MEGYAETFAENAEDAEMANYADFHALKLALRGVNDGIVGTNDYSPLQDGTATINMKSIPSGVYVLRVTDADGKEYHQKIVRK